MILKVLAVFESVTDGWHCIDEHGHKHTVDLVIDKYIEGVAENPASLVGRTFEVECLTPYIEIAYNVREIDDE